MFSFWRYYALTLIVLLLAWGILDLGYQAGEAHGRSEQAPFDLHYLAPELEKSIGRGNMAGL